MNMSSVFLCLKKRIKKKIPENSDCLKCDEIFQNYQNIIPY